MKFIVGPFLRQQLFKDLQNLPTVIYSYANVDKSFQNSASDLHEMIFGKSPAMRVLNAE